jgi:hypothetical protein
VKSTSPSEPGFDTAGGGWNGSLAWAIGFPCSLVLLAILEATHVPPPLLADNDGVMKVAGCVLLAAMFSVLSAATAARPLSRGNFWPVVWLALLAAGWLLFVSLFDWRSLRR